MRRVSLLLTIAVWCIPAQTYADNVWVQVRESRVRSKPLFYASSVSSVRYGDRLTKLSEESGWMRVGAGGQTGYIPLSAVSPKTIVFSSADVATARADSSELVLAGKGFSKEIENSFKQRDQLARYDLVDKVERVANVSPQQVDQFVRDGGLGK